MISQSLNAIYLSLGTNGGLFSGSSLDRGLKRCLDKYPFSAVLSQFAVFFLEPGISWGSAHRLQTSSSSAHIPDQEEGQGNASNYERESSCISIKNDKLDE